MSSGRSRLQPSVMSWNAVHFWVLPIWLPILGPIPVVVRRLVCCVRRWPLTGSSVRVLVVVSPFSLRQRLARAVHSVIALSISLACLNWYHTTIASVSVWIHATSLQLATIFVPLMATKQRLLSSISWWDWSVLSVFISTIRRRVWVVGSIATPILARA